MKFCMFLDQLKNPERRKSIFSESLTLVAVVSAAAMCAKLAGSNLGLDVLILQVGAAWTIVLIVARIVNHPYRGGSPKTGFETDQQIYARNRRHLHDILMVLSSAALGALFFVTTFLIYWSMIILSVFISAFSW